MGGRISVTLRLPYDYNKWGSRLTVAVVLGTRNFPLLNQKQDSLSVRWISKMSGLSNARRAPPAKVLLLKIRSYGKRQVFSPRLGHDLHAHGKTVAFAAPDHHHWKACNPVRNRECGPTVKALWHRTAVAWNYVPVRGT